MEMNEIAERVCSILGDTLKREITVELMRVNGLHSLDVNSMTFLMLVTNIENEFNIEFDDNEINYGLFGDFDQLCALIKKRLEN